MARPDLLDYYTLMDRLFRQSGVIHAVARFGLDISFPNFDAEGNNVPTTLQRTG